MTLPEPRTEVAIVGGGVAGSALAISLAQRGIDVTLIERLVVPRWRACGVYSSPLTRQRLLALGLDADRVASLVRPIEAMDVWSVRGTRCRLAYAPPACGLDRPALDAALLDRAAAAGARVVTGAGVRAIATPDRHGAPARLTVTTAAGQERWRARLVVGADGPGSMVARAFGVDRPIRRLRHAGLTVHRQDPEAAHEGSAMSGRMIVGAGWYCGLAPVPRGRLNIGIVMGEHMLRDRLAAAGDRGTSGVVAGVLAGLAGPPDPWRTGADTDAVQVALPLAQRVRRRAGPGFLLVGDAAGFIDPLSGDGIHRALWSAELAADAIGAAADGRSGELERYDRLMRSRFGAKDLLSWLLQLFLARPLVLEYALRRLATRDDIRATFGAVLADLRPARDVLQPHFLAGLLAP